jgi:hypothetical protein
LDGRRIGLALEIWRAGLGNREGDCVCMIISLAIDMERFYGLDGEGFAGCGVRWDA